MSRTIVDTIERRTCVAAGFAEEQVLKEHTAGLLAGGTAASTASATLDHFLARATRCFTSMDGLKTTTRCGAINNPSPVFGFLPILEPLFRTTNEPNEDNFTVSPCSRQSVISSITSATNAADCARDKPTFW